MKILDCEFPERLLYDVENNVWAELEGETARVGVNAIIGWLSGRIASVSFKERGESVSRGRSLGAIEGPRHFDVVRSPLTGEILEYNGAVKERPMLLNRDPYRAGWFAKVRPLRLLEEAKFLKDVSSAKEELERRLKEMRIHCFAEFPDLEMFEIGVECSAVLVRLNELIAGAQIGAVVHVVSDDPTAEIEMARWSDETGNEVLESRFDNSVYHFIVKKKG